MCDALNKLTEKWGLVVLAEDESLVGLRGLVENCQMDGRDPWLVWISKRAT